MGCTTPSRVLTDIWEEWDEELMRLGCTAAAAASGNPELAVKCLEEAGKLNEALDRMVQSWNRNAGNSWARLGPRRLDLDRDLQGRLLGPGDRSFITAHPMDEDKATIRVQERNGRGKTEVTVCAHSPDGGSTNLASMDFNEDKRAKRKVEFESKTVSGLKGKILSVIFDGQSATNKFAYTLHVDTH